MNDPEFIRADDLYVRAEDQPEEKGPLARRAKALEETARELVHAVNRQKRVARVVSAALVFDLFLTFGLMNSQAAICDERNLQARKQKALWAPLLGTSPRPEAVEFSKRLDTIFNEIDCSFISVTKRSLPGGDSDK